VLKPPVEELADSGPRPIELASLNPGHQFGQLLGGRSLTAAKRLVDL
jgi:hypothetical protein